MIFTRYLYIKEEVEKALFISLLKRNREQAIFWFNELKESGIDYKDNDAFEQMYYDIYFTSNETETETESSLYSLSLFENLINIGAPCNLDIYNLRTAKRNELDKFEEESQYEDFSFWLREKKYSQLANYLLHDCDEIILPYIHKVISKYFNITLANLNKNKRIYYLGVILKQGSKCKESHCISQCKEIKKEDKEVRRPWQILSRECKYGIDEYNCLGLFELERNTISREELLNRYHHQWLYYASFSLLWKNRIEKYNGTINHETKQVIFSEEVEGEGEGGVEVGDSDFEKFYNLFNLEPDEQKIEVQNKSIGIISNPSLSYITQ